MPILTTELLKAWYIIAISIGTWTCLSLLISSKGDKRVKRTMLLFIGLLIIPTLNAYITLVNHQPIHWLNMASVSMLLIYGPLLYIVIQHTLLKTVTIPALLVHSLPFIFMTVCRSLNIEFIFQPIFVYITFISALSYLTYSIYLAATQYQKLYVIATKHQNTTYFWLLFLAAGLIIYTLLDCFIYTLHLNGHILNRTLISIFASALALYINAISLFALYQPEVFSQYQSDPLPVKPEPPQRPRNIELSQQAAKELDEQLNLLAQNHGIHHDENMSLQKLASMLGVTRNQLSELFNFHKQISFYDFLNEQRYRDSIALLEGNQGELTIADIAYQAGFNNRNTFYKVFKEKSGLTPGEYKKRQKGN